METISSDVDKAMQELERESGLLAEALRGLAERLGRITEYQSTVLRVNRQLSSWLGNVEDLSRHRRNARTASQTAPLTRTASQTAPLTRTQTSGPQV